MSRFDRSANRAPQRNIQAVKEIDKQKLSKLTPILKIFSSFYLIKQKRNFKVCFNKLKSRANSNKKRNQIMVAFLNGFYFRKYKSSLCTSFRSLIANRDSKIKKQNQQRQNFRNQIRTKSANIMNFIFKRIYLSKIKTTFQFLNHQSKIRAKVHNLRNRNLSRIFSGIYLAKLALGLDKIKSKKLSNTYKNNSLKRIQSMLKLKIQHKMINFFTNLQAFVIKKQLDQKNSRGLEESPQSINDKQQEQKIDSKIDQVSPNIDQNKKKDLEDKNKKLQQQIERLKKDFTKVEEQYKEQIVNLQSQHQRLKFNNGILQQAIQDLQSEIINRQKKLRKGMPISEVWERIYSNFLLLLKQHEGQILPKQKILQYLQCPLVPLGLDIESLKEQNQILAELLNQYKNFYQGTEIKHQSEQSILPYDILVTKNKFLYGIVEALIRQGIGTQSQIKQLQTDLEHAIKQN